MSGAWCVQLQGGGGRRCGASATDDNAADARARPRVCDLIQTTGPSAGGARRSGGVAVRLTAVPYCGWAHRRRGPMPVWSPGR
ncbi:hypothetical protein ABZ568_15750 [Streptomyces olindensis]|uniref:Non-reducing end beta-L-arabinofuranosidase-like GH127 C-terminal domain-containing protein n=1 Tax=Streptomyces olindensis TaxID=358823 RepID=A0ABV2XUZ4_9ACTN